MIFQGGHYLKGEVMKKILFVIVLVCGISAVAFAFAGESKKTEAPQAACLTKAETPQEQNKPSKIENCGKGLEFVFRLARIQGR